MNTNNYQCLKAKNISRKGGFANANVPATPRISCNAQEIGVKFIGCQMTMNVMGSEKVLLLMELK